MRSRARGQDHALPQTPSGTRAAPHLNRNVKGQRAGAFGVALHVLHCKPHIHQNGAVRLDGVGVASFSHDASFDRRRRLPSSWAGPSTAGLGAHASPKQPGTRLRGFAAVASPSNTPPLKPPAPPRTSCAWHRPRRGLRWARRRWPAGQSRLTNGGPGVGGGRRQIKRHS
jgi:hypothetical protein